MKKIIMMLVTCTSFIYTVENSIERYIPHHTSHTSPVSNRIKELVEQYNNFLIDFGQGVTFSQQDIDKLFAPNFKKIINRDIVIDGSSNLVDQLTQARKAVGNWTIKVTYLIPAANGTDCSLRYILTSSSHGTFDVVALVHFSTDWKIESIDEMAIIIPAEQN